jgi:hypothetical protein
MAAEAHVTSLEALGTFRSRVILFAEVARRSLYEVNSEVRRTREWVINDRRHYWQSEVRRRGKRVDEAQQELLAARMSSMKEDTAAQRNAVTQSRRALHEAEEKLRRVRHWGRQFDIVVDPLVKQLGGLRTTADHELPEAIAFLSNAQRALEGYVDRVDPPPVALDSGDADGAMEISG